MAQGFEIGIETNGTLLPPPGIDWICVSPKADAEQKLTRGDELKLVYPQDEAPPERLPVRISAISSCSRWTMQDRAANTAGGDGLLPGPSAMAAVAADPQIAGNSLTLMRRRIRAMRRGMTPPASSHLQNSRPGPISSPVQRVVSWIPGMFRWFPPRWPLAIIGYSFWVAYA